MSEEGNKGAVRDFDTAVAAAGRFQDVCYIKIDKDFIAFGFGEVVNPAQEEGASMHPVVWTLSSLDEATEERIGALVKKAAS